MSQTINQAMQYGSLCFLLGGVAALQPQEERAAVRPGTVMGQSVGEPTRDSSA